MQFMIEGGWGMWAMVVAAVGAGIYAATRPSGGRSAALAAGAFGVVLLGILGMSTGMEAVAAGIGRHRATWPEAGYTVALGLGELANNGTLAVVLAALLCVAALATRSQPGE
jgi:hypothetical protein